MCLNTESGNIQFKQQLFNHCPDWDAANQSSAVAKSQGYWIGTRTRTPSGQQLLFSGINNKLVSQ
jgi:hypothetical protein